MAKYLDKWKDLFPDTVGGTTRPSEAVSDQEEFNTDGFPQFIAQDPVNYALQNAFLKQFLSNDAWLWVKQKQANQALDDHKVDTQAHAKGISGNAGSATKLANARTINLSGAVTADAVSFDGTADATINVKTLDASKLKGTASVSTTGNAATATKVVTTAADGASANIAEARMASNDLARIRVSGETNAGELALETADDGSEPIVARQYTGVYTNAVRTAKILDESGNTSFPGTVVAPKFTGSLNGNAATATKLSTARKINITGNATGSAAFDGSGDISISTTVNESKHAVNADTATHANDVTDAVIRYGVSGTDEKFTAAASGVIGLLKTQTGSNDLTSMNKLRSYIGSVNDGTDWYDVLSIRHRNGASDGQNFGLLMYSGLTNTDSIKYKKQPGSSGWTEERTLLDSSNYNNYVPTKTGTGASGTWPISVSGNAATATKATNANTAAACSGNSATATKLATARAISLTGNASGSANFDGSGNVSINTTVSQAANADKVDGIHAASLFYNKGDWDANNWATIGTYQVNNNPPVSGAYDWGQVISSSTTDGRFQLYASHRYAGTGRLYYRTGYGGDKQPWNTILDSENYNLFAPTKTGGGASGTWGINISGNAASATTSTKANTASSVAWSGVTGKPGTYPPSAHNHDSAYPSVTGARASGTWGISISGNAASATNADKVDGYHASDLLSKMQGVLPKTAAEVGQFRELVVNDSHQIKLPDGGTWAYFAFCYTSWSGDNSDGEHRIRMSSGIAAGGTVIHTDSYINSGSLRRMTGTSADNSSTNGGAAVGGFCWRIA